MATKQQKHSKIVKDDKGNLITITPDGRRHPSTPTERAIWRGIILWKHHRDEVDAFVKDVTQEIEQLKKQAGK